MQEPQRVGFRTANGDTGLQGANMPQNQPMPTQSQFEMPNVMGQPLTPMPGSFGMQPQGRPMPPQMTGGPMGPQMTGGPMQNSPMNFQMSTGPMPPQMTGGPMGPQAGAGPMQNSPMQDVQNGTRLTPMAGFQNGWG
jgi:hypothetical protein